MRLFLDHLTPHRAIGSRKALPFLINTAVLYEKFVYAWLSHWLKENLNDSYYLKRQEHYPLGDHINYYIDLVLYRRANHQAIAVLDTKYKTSKKPSNDDLNQIIAYATFKQVKQAILIYPEDLPHEIDQVIAPGIRVKTITFGLKEDLERNGHNLIKLISDLHSAGDDTK